MFPGSHRDLVAAGSVLATTTDSFRATKAAAQPPAATATPTVIYTGDYGVRIVH